MRCQSNNKKNCLAFKKNIGRISKARRERQTHREQRKEGGWMRKILRATVQPHKSSTFQHFDMTNNLHFHFSLAFYACTCILLLNLQPDKNEGISFIWRIGLRQRYPDFRSTHKNQRPLFPLRSKHLSFNSRDQQSLLKMGAFVGDISYRCLILFLNYLQIYTIFPAKM